MGSKPSNAVKQNRPESGGADRNDLQEKSGLLEREKQQFAQSQQAKQNADVKGGQDTGSSGFTGDRGSLND